MKALDTGEDKIQKICNVLRHETLEPAKKEADAIIEEAKGKAEKIIANAHEKGQHLLDEARKEIEQERNVFHSSLDQAAKQSLEVLRQSVEHELFDDQLVKTVESATADPKVIAKLVEAIIHSIEKDGIHGDLSVLIPKTIKPEEVNLLLAKDVIEKLKEKSVVLGDITGGTQVKIHDKRMIIDITDAALRELLSRYVRKDFRKFIFKEEV